MSYTTEFEKWAENNTLESPLYHPEIQAHFWLSAFVRLVKEEAGGDGMDDFTLRTAFTALVERFGLREKP